MTSATASRTAAAVRTRTPAKRRRRGRPHMVAHLVLGIGGFIMAFPFLWQIVMSLSTNAQVRSVVPTF